MGYPKYSDPIDDKQVIIILKEARSILSYKSNWVSNLPKRIYALDEFKARVEPYDLRAKQWSVEGAIRSRMARGTENVKAAIIAMEANIPKKLDASLKEFDASDAVWGDVVQLFDQTIFSLTNKYFQSLTKIGHNIRKLFTMKIDSSSNDFAYPQCGDTVMIRTSNGGSIKMKIDYCFFRGEYFGELYWQGIAKMSPEKIDKCQFEATAVGEINKRHKVDEVESEIDDLLV